MKTQLAAIAALCLLISCDDGGISAPPDEVVFTGTAPRFIVLSSNATGPLSEPAAMSFEAFARELSEAGEDEAIIVGLPLSGLPAGSPIEMESGLVTIDSVARTVSLVGDAPFRGFLMRFALIGSWHESEPHFALLIAFDCSSLGDVIPVFAGTPLAALSLEGAAIVLSDSEWDVPESVSGLVQQIAPNLTTIPTGVYFHGPFTVPAPLLRALALLAGGESPTATARAGLGAREAGAPAVSLLPALRGGLGLDPAHVLMDPGSVASSVLEGLNVAAALPVPSDAFGPIRVVEHTLSATWLDGTVVLALDSDVTFRLDGEERPFAFNATIDPRGAGAASLEGHSTQEWTEPFGLVWLDVDSLALELSDSGGAWHARLSTHATAFDTLGIGLIVDPLLPELSLSLTADLDASALVQLATNLSDVGEIRLPHGGPTLRSVNVTLRPGSSTPFVIEGKGTIVDSVEADALLTLVDVNGSPTPLFAFHMGPGLIGHLVPQLANTVLDEALPGGTLVIPFAGGGLATIDRAELPATAVAFFDRAFAGLDDYELEVSPVVHLNAALPLNTVPSGAVKVLGLDSTGYAVLEGSIGVTLALLGGSGAVHLDSIALAADVPFAGPAAGLPDWLQPRHHSISFSWNSRTDTTEFVLDSRLRAVFPDDSVELALNVHITRGGDGGHVSMHGSSGAWHNPWGLHWLEMDSVRLHIEGDPDSVTVDLESDLEVAGHAARLDIRADDDGNAELELGFHVGLTLDSVAHVAAALGGVDGSVDVNLPAGGPSLDDITAIVRPGADVPFTLLGSGTLHGGALDVAAMLTLVHTDAGLTPVLIFSTGETSLARIVPAIGANSPLDLRVPELGIALPTSRPLTIPSSHLPQDALEFLAPIFGDDPFDLHLELALRIDAPLSLEAIPATLANALALDRSGVVRLGGSLGVKLDSLTRAGAVIDSLRLFAAAPRAGRPGIPGWPGWLEPRRDSIAVYWKRDPAETRFDLRSTMMAFLHEDSLEFRFVAELDSDSVRDRVELHGTSGAWDDAFGISWLDLDSIGLGFIHENDNVSVDLTTALELRDQPATLKLTVNPPKELELDIEIDSLALADIEALLHGVAPSLQLSEGFPANAVIKDAFVYVRLGEETGFSMGGEVDDFLGDTARALVSVARGVDGALLLAGFAVEGLELGELVKDVPHVRETLRADTVYLDVLTFDDAAVLFSSVDATAAGHTFDDHALAFLHVVFGDTADVPLKAGVSVVARRELPPDGPLDHVFHALAPGAADRTVTLAGTIPLGLITHGASMTGLELELTLPDMAPVDPGWFRHGQLGVVVSGRPSIGLEGEIGVTVDEHDIDFEVEAEVTPREGGALLFHGSADLDRKWEDPFGVEGLALSRLGLDLTLSAVTVGLCIGGSIEVGSKDIEGAIGLGLNPESGVPSSGLFYARTDSGIALADLAQLQDAMFAGDPLSLRAMPDMRIDSLTLLAAVPRPGALNLSCVPESVDGFFDVGGNLWIELDPTAGMQRLATAHFELSSQGIVASGSLSSQTIGPISWRDPAIDLALTLADQHLRVSGGASIGAWRVDTLVLSLSRDSMVFETDINMAHDLEAHITASASPSLTSPAFNVTGEVDGAYVDSLSTRVYADLRLAAETAQAFLATLESNPAHIDLETAIREAAALRDAAHGHWQDAVHKIESLTSAQAQCRWRVCTDWYAVRIAAWIRVRDARKELYDLAYAAWQDLVEARDIAAHVKAGLVRLEAQLHNGQIQLSGAGFHSSLADLTAGRGIELHVTGSVNGKPFDVACDLNADFARNVAGLVRGLMPHEFAIIPGL